MGAMSTSFYATLEDFTFYSSFGDAAGGAYGR